MLKNYLKTALRTLYRYKSYAAINVAGLAVGMTCCLLIVLFVQDELSYDRHHEQADQIYRVTRSWQGNQGATSLHLARVAAPIGPLLEQAFPEVETVTRIWGGGYLVSVGDQHFQEDDYYYTDPHFFEIFTVPFLKGLPETALSEPYTLVLSESTARKYFGDADPIGQVVRVSNTYDFRVTGVMEDMPPNSHFHFDMLGSLATLEAIFPEDQWSSWGWNNYATYLRLAEGSDPEALSAKFPGFLDTYYEENGSRETRLHLQALTDIHLHSHLDGEFEPNGSSTYAYLFSAIALLILLIACFNFMNLATARSARRAREVGLRKVLGAQRGQLIKQFLGEAVLLALVALLLAGASVEVLLPFFNDFTGKSLSLIGGDAGFTLLVLAGVTLFVGVVAGSYPAFFLSSFRPAQVLKGCYGGGPWRSRFRSVLVVTQFAISIVLIVCVAVVFRQVSYVQNQPLGFDKELLVTLPATSEMRQDFEALRTRLLAHPGVRAVTASQRVPSGPLLDNIDATAEVNGTMTPPLNIPLVAVDHAFIDTYGMELVAGRPFSRTLASDSTEAVILNETAVATFGWASPHEAIGQRFTLDGTTLDRRSRVIGVVKDFHFESLHETISPLILYIRPSLYWLVTARIVGRDVPKTLEFLEDQWHAYLPNYPITARFIDERFSQLYESERRIGRLFGIFALLAVFVAGLGLFGLASFIGEQRTKEIGVRKVLGASVGSILLLLSSSFIRLILVALLLAAPVAYVAMHRWLQNFAYAVDLGPGVFLLAGALALAVALLTVSYQALKAALADPVDALRYE